ncbi:disease resistance protein TAO1 [Selaginella moellendorffii]|uniref:disease resistance protein TAO1 n=1 Tax=Selaginella moellendorffii TaxID=88036 RepID=UPI000D1C2336|nr:disease resistance protein TAO1 [Selaginella moellendorffii]|eukprot:XP_024518226.1 disease resistance protein TAO1 [Selaginella moellendorffii]
MRDVGDAFTSNYSRISLFGCRISEIPLLKKNRVKVSSTTCLLLDYNRNLTALPSLSHFRSLKVLCLSHTGVVSLPHSIGQLKTLETLDLSSSRSLQSIPDSLGNLANLSYLNLEDCRKLKSFPVDALLKLTKLVYLNGRGCWGMWTCHRLHHRLFKQKKCLNRRFGRFYLDGMFQALTELAVLIIDTGLAVDLPASIGKLAHLKQLEIHGQTGGTCESFKGLPDLEILRLEGLELPLTSDWDWSRFPRLRTLEVSCFGKSGFKVTSNMENLQELVIEDNDHLEGLPFLTQEMFPMLTKLCLWGCQKLIGVPTISQLASLKVLDINTCPSLKDLSISFLPNLEAVNLYCCDDVTTINISECPSLTVVRLESFRMHARVVAFGGNFPRLQAIILGGFEQLPDSLGAMDAFPQLTWLQISSCGIDQLPEWFASLTTLRTLELCSLKNLDVIPDGVARLPLLRELDLRGCKKINMLPFADSEDSSFYPSLENLCLIDTSVSQKHLSEHLRKIPKLSWEL